MHGEPWVEMTTSLWRPEDVPLDLLLLPIDPSGRTFADWEMDLSAERICTVSPTGSLEPGRCAVVPSTLAGVQYVAVASLLDDDRRMVNSEGLEACIHQCLDVCGEFGLSRKTSGSRNCSVSSRTGLAGTCCWKSKSAGQTRAGWRRNSRAPPEFTLVTSVIAARRTGTPSRRNPFPCHGLHPPQWTPALHIRERGTASLL